MGWIRKGRKRKGRKSFASNLTLEKKKTYRRTKKKKIAVIKKYRIKKRTKLIKRKPFLVLNFYHSLNKSISPLECILHTAKFVLSS